MRLISKPPASASNSSSATDHGKVVVNSAFGFVALVNVAGDKQMETAGQREDAAAGAAALMAVAHAALIFELDEVAGPRSICGQESRLPAIGRLLRIGQQIQRLAAADRAMEHDVGQAGQAETLIMLAQAGDLRLDHLIGLGVERALGVPVGERRRCAADDKAKTVT